MPEILGFIGMGIMGKPMTVNLLNAGYPVFIHSRRRESCRGVAGALVCDSPKAVAENANIIFICVSDTSDVEQVILGEKGIIHGARPGMIVVDMSTIAADATRKMASALSGRGFHMLDAPVSGGEKGAIQGTLSIMVGGKPEIFGRVKPYFERMGKNIIHVGDHGAGQIAKACNQIVVGGTIEAVAEALLLAEKTGVDGAKVREALMGGFAASKILDVHGKRMLENDYEPGFKSKLHRKDMGIVMDTAEKAGIHLPAASLVAAHLDKVIANGDGELDSAAIFKALKKP